MAARPADHEEPTLIPDDPEAGSGLPEPPLDGDAGSEWPSVPAGGPPAADTTSTATDRGVDPPPTDAASPTVRHGRLARFGAGLLSAIVPGLGHLVTGRRRLAALFVAPVVVGLLILVALFLTQNTLSLAASLIDPSIVGAILVIEVLFLVWRVAAVVSSMVDRSFPRFRVADGIGLLLVLALVVLPQAGIAVLTSATQAAESTVFVNEPFPSDDAQSPAPSFSPGDSLFPSGSPSPSASAALPPRVTVLLIGIDSGVGRNTAATDTMIVASLDPVAKTVSLVSVPRDMVNAPLPKGRTYRPKINGLVADVRWHPGDYPGYNGHGQAVLAYSLGKMLGIHIDYYAQVDLEGFVQAVNAVGGVDVSVDHAMCDAAYDEYGFNGYSIGAGRHHMNGNQALAYARIRKSAGESDFTRAARQQQVVVALKDKVVKGGFLNDPLGLLRAVGQTIQTNIPPGVVRQLAPLAADIGPNDVYRAVVSYPMVRPGFDVRGSIQLPNFDKIAALGAAMFTPVGTRPTGRYAAKPPTSVARGPAQPAPSCSAAPRPTPKPTPKPKPKPTPKPTGTPAPTATATEPPSPSGP